jgi:Na+/proline symporter
MLATLDWIVMAAFMALILYIGLSYAKSGSQNLESFFLGGRNLPWYIAGLSMVATTFAADTPLAVTEIVGQKGIAGNWLWWSFLAGGMLTTFFFAGLWRRSGVLTEAELVELRYSGPEAKVLRGFKAVYLGVFMNLAILAWVNVAMISILQGVLGITPEAAFWYTALLMLITAVYSSVSGLTGIAMTDAIQFFVAMAGCIVLAILVLQAPAIGGLSGLKTQINNINPRIMNFLPTVGNQPSVGTFGLSIMAFFAYAGVQWWSAWYPGAEPGGGGYIAQRMMSTRSDKESIYATLFFQIAHYCIRPWPWIIVGLAALVLYPELPAESAKLGYVYAMRDFLPAGLKGLLLVAFISAYMSTISTQLNWGSGYVINDLYQRFINKDASDKHYVMASRVMTIVLMILGLYMSTFINSISGTWEFIMQCGAGLGLVLILRWYWWRINAWSEISATIAPFVATAICYYKGIEFPEAFLLTVAYTTVIWLIVTFMTNPTDEKVLHHFYQKVRPGGAWPQRFKAGVEGSSNMGILVLCWLLGITLTYSALFFIGKLLFLEWQNAAILGIVMLLSAFGLKTLLPKARIFS